MARSEALLDADRPSSAEAATAPRSMDEAAFTEFYEKTARALRSYIRRICGDAGAAEDILQEAYVRFLREARPDAVERERVGFLYKVATNLVHDDWRRASRERRSLLGFEWPRPAQKDPVLRHDMSRAFAELKPRERELLWLAYVEGWHHEQIAEILDLKVRSIRVLLYRARGRLARLLARRGLVLEAEP
jgi:RNA polymerase sigma-70 factor (ECF subfamily)